MVLVNYSPNEYVMCLFCHQDTTRATQPNLLAKYTWKQGCGVGVGVARSRRFSGGVRFLRTVGVGVGIGFFDVQIESLFTSRS